MELCRTWSSRYHVFRFKAPFIPFCWWAKNIYECEWNRNAFKVLLWLTFQKYTVEETCGIVQKIGRRYGKREVVNKKCTNTGVECESKPQLVVLYSFFEYFVVELILRGCESENKSYLVDASYWNIWSDMMNWIKFNPKNLVRIRNQYLTLINHVERKLKFFYRHHPVDGFL